VIIEPEYRPTGGAPWSGFEAGKRRVSPSLAGLKAVMLDATLAASSPSTMKRLPGTLPRHPRDAAAGEFREALKELDLSTGRFAHALRRAGRTVRHWTAGTRPVPPEVGILVRLARAGAETVAQVEQAATPVRAGNGGGAIVTRGATDAQPEPAVTPTDSGGAIAGAGEDAERAQRPCRRPRRLKKLCELAAGCCRWPFGDPATADFSFCVAPQRDLERPIA
jgi:DNA-binding transcriptional regulator YiaG